jgi:hypothetical protein
MVMTISYEQQQYFHVIISQILTKFVPFLQLKKRRICHTYHMAKRGKIKQPVSRLIVHGAKSKQHWDCTNSIAPAHSLLINPRSVCGEKGNWLKTKFISSWSKTEVTWHSNGRSQHPYYIARDTSQTCIAIVERWECMDTFKKKKMQSGQQFSEVSHRNMMTWLYYKRLKKNKL